LLEDWNLDTGIPMTQNGSEQHKSADEKVRFAFGVEILVCNYNNLRYE